MGPQLDGNANGNGKPNGKTNPYDYSCEPRNRSAFRAMVQDFSPIWFTWCMNAGIIAILLHQLPYQFPGLYVLSTIAYVLDLVLFIIFSLIALTRFVWFGRTAYYEITDNIKELSFGGTWPIAFETLASLTALIVSNASWGTHAFTLVAYVMWWFGTAWTLGYGLFAYITMIRRRLVKPSEPHHLPPAVFIPIVGVATCGTTGGLIASYSYDISGRLAVPIIIVSFMAVGLALLIGTFLYVYLLNDLMIHGWQQPDEIATLWIFVGPVGQCSAALQILGSAANTYMRFAEYNKGTFLTATAAQPLNVACILLAFMLTGLSVFWCFMAATAMIEKAWNRELKWTISWNSLIFPTATLATSFQNFSVSLDSPTFRVVTTGMIVLFVVIFFLNAGFAYWKIYKGELLIVRRNPRVKEEHDD